MSANKASRQEIEDQLSVLRAIAIAQARWREIAEAIEGTPLPIEGLTAEQEAAAVNLQLRRLAPQARERVAQEVAALERILRDFD
jgi:hypothetical protein